VKRSSIKTWFASLKNQGLTIYFIAVDPGTGWIVKFIALLVAGYAFSPIDLIPDFIPIIGWLDDFVVVLLGYTLVLKLTPEVVKNRARIKARQTTDYPVSRGGALVVLLIWLGVIFLVWTILK